MNDGRGRAGYRLRIRRRRSFVGDFAHRHFLTRPRQGLLPWMRDRL
jgi:hypothetical protein